MTFPFSAALRRLALAMTVSTGDRPETLGAISEVLDRILGDPITQINCLPRRCASTGYPGRR